MKIEDLALQRSKYKYLTDDEWRWFLQQVEGRERTADKLPAFAAIEDWWYPVRLSCEQCSSELAARYKASLISNLGFQNSNFVDLTGGYGVDTYFLSEQFEHSDYVEQNAELCRIAAHNFRQPTQKMFYDRPLDAQSGEALHPKGKEISVHCCTAEEFLQTAGQYDLIFLDPARRDSHGGKVFRLEDCTPNVVELLPTLLAHSKRLMLKLSPMLDLTQAMHKLKSDNGQGTKVNWDIHIVAIKNEVKEVLLVSHQPSDISYQPTITAIDLEKMDQAFVFTREEEQNCPFTFHLSSINFLYEPNAAILKAGAYKLVAERFGLSKLDVNTHLYVSEQFVENFPGRVWRIKPTPALPKGKELNQANILVRNYPLTPEQLKKKLRLRDGGTDFVIGCRVNGKPTLFLAERV
ncbi:MAG: SAM-dependent methyltransferase [Paludibacteraceae bacterium]|nr:SAM-dependent methyltransferase [Paludibacteraceae bacterium]